MTDSDEEKQEDNYGASSSKEENSVGDSAILLQMKSMGHTDEQEHPRRYRCLYTDKKSNKQTIIQIVPPLRFPNIDKLGEYVPM